MWLSWLALVPLALALRGARPAAAAGLGALFGWLATLVVIAWLVPTLTGHFERPAAWSALFAALVAAAAAAPFLALAFAGHARALADCPAALRPALFAATWVAAELARTHLGLRSPWARLGDAHASSAWLRQIADATGVYGVSGLVALGNATLAEGLWLAQRRAGAREWRALAAAGSAFALLLAAALGYGAMRSRELARPEPGLRLALVQANEPPELRWKRASAQRVLARYAVLTEQALEAPAPPQLVVWPENALQVSPQDPLYASSLRQLAGRAPILLGAPRSAALGGARRTYNSAWLLPRTGSVSFYDKRRPLPFGETQPFGRWLELGRRGDLDAAEFTAGAAPGLFLVQGERLGLLICMEALYPADARSLAAAGATLLVNLSNDGWYRGRGGAEQHLAQSVFRAVETRLPLVRSTTTGISAILDASGRTVAELGAGQAGVLSHEVPRGAARRPLYVRIGDAFAGGCVVLWLVALAASWRSETGKLASNQR